MSFDKKKLSFTLRQQENLNLREKSVSLSVEALTEEGLKMPLELKVTYETDGPWFAQSSPVPDITCSNQDLNWSFTLPAIGAADQQEVKSKFTTVGEFAAIFTFDEPS